MGPLHSGARSQGDTTLQYETSETRGVRRAGARRRLPLLILAVVALGFTDACASSGSVRLEATAPRGHDLVWPLPPDPPRIRFVRDFSSARDLGFRRSLFSRFVDFVRGRESADDLQHPYGIAVTDDERVYVVDTAAKGVHVYDLPGGRYRFVSDDRFSSPIGIAVDSVGTMYVTDSELGTITILDAEGELQGRLRGPLLRPTGVALNADTDLLYVVDTEAHRVVIFDLLSQTVVGEFGTRGTGPGELNYPTQIAMGPDGRVYVSDSMNFRVQVFEPDGSPVRLFGRLGDAVGEFARPKGIGVDSTGRVFVVEGLYDVINVFDPSGRLLLSFGGAGTGAGTFWLATGLAVDSKGRVFVADSYNGRVQVFQTLGARP